MIRLEVFGASEPMAALAQSLDENDDVSRVRLADATRPGHAVVVAAVQPYAVDKSGRPAPIDVPDADVTLTRVEVLGRSRAEADEAGLVWEDVLGMAARNHDRWPATSR